MTVLGPGPTQRLEAAKENADDQRMKVGPDVPYLTMTQQAIEQPKKEDALQPVA